MLTRQLPLFLAFLLAPGLGAGRQLAAQTAASSKACTAAEYRQFDFWIGEWDVTLPNGSRAGSNRIEPILGGCALRETWAGARGSHGTSYNAYDASRRRWHQTWVDDQGGLLVLEGGFAGNRMTLEGETRDSAGHLQRQRIAWEPSDSGSVRQVWTTSSDSGATWTTAFDGRYVKH
jgi:hypothetical protein